jgi:hypothetical protein
MLHSEHFARHQKLLVICYPRVSVNAGILGMQIERERTQASSSLRRAFRFLLTLLRAISILILSHSL